MSDSLDRLIDEAWERMGFALDLRNAIGQPRVAISDALHYKLLFRGVDLVSSLDQLESEFSKLHQEIFTKLGLQGLSKSEQHSILLANQEDFSLLSNLHRAIKKLNGYLSLHDASRIAPEVEAALLDSLEFATLACKIRIQHDVIPLIERGLYSSELSDALDFWKTSSASQLKESEWQAQLSKNRGILGKALGGAVTFLHEQASLGSTNLEGVGNKFSDFMFLNSFTKDCILVEIKTPTTKLLGAQYRNTYPLSAEISGAIAQCLLQKNVLLKNYYQKHSTSKGAFEAYAPRCVVIAGSLEHEASGNEKLLEAFSVHREAIRSNVELITFDELYSQFSSFNMAL
jgi:hypothetical protein